MKKLNSVDITNSMPIIHHETPDNCCGCLVWSYTWESDMAVGGFVAFCNECGAEIGPYLLEELHGK